MFCKNCGTENVEGVQFCKNCGEKLAMASNTKNVSNSGKSGGWFKSKDGKLLTGICAGLGKKYGQNPWVFRVSLIIAGFIPLLGWALWIAYLVGIFALKYEDE